MSTAQKVGTALASALLLILAFVVGQLTLTGVLGASINRYEAGVWQFGNGIYAGLAQQFSIGSTGNVSTTGTLAVTATTTIGTSGTPSYWTVGGVKYAAVRKSLTAATTTPCSILNPFGSATTTVTAITLQITTATSTGGTASFDIATSTTAYATSSVIVAARTLAQGAVDTVSWFPSGFANAQLGPNQYVLVKHNSAGQSGWTHGGTCSATFATP
jgi:hypothetical protein